MSNRQQGMPRPYGGGMQEIMPIGGMVMMPPQGFPQYPVPGMMMMPAVNGMAPVPAMQSMPPPAVNPQLTQMLADAARGGRASNIFFKTRLCNKWRQGACTFGDKCTYAHGQHELRFIPPELLAQLEREQQAAERSQSSQHEFGIASQQGRGRTSNGANLGGPTQSREATAGASDTRQTIPSTASGAVSKSQLYYKTRLCIRFMQMGYCNRGASCTFAHGYEDLRLMEYNQNDPDRATHGASDRHQHTVPGQHLSRSKVESAGSGHHSGRPGASAREMQQDSSSLPPAVARARAGSAMMGVGNVNNDGNSTVAVEAAVREGSALRETPYADSAEDLVTMEQAR